MCCVGGLWGHTEQVQVHTQKPPLCVSMHVWWYWWWFLGAEKPWDRSRVVGRDFFGGGLCGSGYPDRKEQGWWWWWDA